MPAITTYPRAAYYRARSLYRAYALAARHHHSGPWPAYLDELQARADTAPQAVKDAIGRADLSAGMQDELYYQRLSKDWRPLFGSLLTTIHLPG